MAPEPEQPVPATPVSVTGVLVGVGVDAANRTVRTVAGLTMDGIVKVLFVMAFCVLAGIAIYLTNKVDVTAHEREAYLMRTTEENREKDRQFHSLQVDLLNRRADEREEKIRKTADEREREVRGFFAAESEKNRKTLDNMSDAVGRLTKASIMGPCPHPDCP